MVSHKSVLICGVAFLALTAAPAAQAQQRMFDIPAQEAAHAIPEFARQANLQIVAPADDLPGVRTKALRGNLEARAALKTLLQGTGLEIAEDQGGIITLRRSASAGSRGRATGEFEAGQGPAASASAEGEESEIVVTGTLIRGIPPIAPLTTLDGEEIRRSGRLTVGEALAELPQNFAGGQNPTNIGARGSSGSASDNAASAPNLRGLGGSSTLTLMNGKRLARSVRGYTDVSVVPVAAVERIEVSTDGASAIYGADAVGGVVNLILRRDYNGAETSVYVSRTADGGGGAERYSQVIGTTWSSGDIVASYEHLHRAALEASERSYTQAAASPTDLSPRERRNSIFFSLNQDIGGTKVFMRSVATRRDTLTRVTDNQVANPFYTQETAGRTTQYGATVGAEVALHRDWSSELSHSRSGDIIQYRHLERVPGDYNQLVEFEEKGQISEADIALRGALFSLSSGSVRTVIGGGLRDEAYQFQIQGRVHRPDRKVKHGYAEVWIPLVGPATELPWLQRLNADIAFRWEDYNDAGSAVSPKLGAIAEFPHGLRVSGTWGKSFRAPTAIEAYQPGSVAVYSGTRFGLKAETAVMWATGGNPGLKPERAETWSASLRYSPDWASRLLIEATYSEIYYNDRIVAPVATPTSALRDPTVQEWVTASPSADRQQAAIGSNPFSNHTGRPYDPGSVAYLIDGRKTNALSEQVRAFDLSVSHKWQLGEATVTGFGAATWLNYWQQLSAATLGKRISGTVFHPPDFKANVGFAVEWYDWSFGTKVHYQSDIRDNVSASERRIDSWTTVDLRLDYESSRGPLRNFRIGLAATNIFNNAPPYADPANNVWPGLPYDTANASPFGRVVSLVLAKGW